MHCIKLNERAVHCLRNKLLLASGFIENSEVEEESAGRNQSWNLTTHDLAKCVIRLGSNALEELKIASLSEAIRTKGSSKS